MHGGAKRIITPDEGGQQLPKSVDTGPDPKLITALAKAWPWQKMLDSGQYGSLADLAAEEKVNPSTFSRYLRLVTLAPDLIAAILNGDAQLAIQRLLEQFSEACDEQPNALFRPTL